MFGVMLSKNKTSNGRRMTCTLILCRMSKRPATEDAIIHQPDAKRFKGEPTQPQDLPGPLGVPDMVRVIARLLDMASRHSLALTCGALYRWLVRPGPPVDRSPTLRCWSLIASVTAEAGYSKLFVYWARHGYVPKGIWKPPETLLDKLWCDAILAGKFKRISAIADLVSEVHEPVFKAWTCVMRLLDVATTWSKFCKGRAILRRVWLQLKICQVSNLDTLSILRTIFARLIAPPPEYTFDLVVEAISEMKNMAGFITDFLFWHRTTTLRNYHRFKGVRDLFNGWAVLARAMPPEDLAGHIVQYLAAVLGTPREDDRDGLAQIVTLWQTHACLPATNSYRLFESFNIMGYATEVPFYQWSERLPGFTWFQTPWWGGGVDGVRRLARYVSRDHLLLFLPPAALATIMPEMKGPWLHDAIRLQSAVSRETWQVVWQHGCVTTPLHRYLLNQARNRTTVLNFFATVPLLWLEGVKRGSTFNTLFMGASAGADDVALIKSTQKLVRRDDSAAAKIVRRRGKGSWPPAIANIIAQRIVDGNQ